jgi:hypothetical protein
VSKFLLAAVVTLAVAGAAAAEHYFARIVGVDAAKGTVVFKVGFSDKATADKGPAKARELKATVIRECVIREGSYRLGKPAKLVEGAPLENGLRNFVFRNASAAMPLRANIYTADADNKEQGIKQGDIIKILVHPQQ